MNYNLTLIKSNSRLISATLLYIMIFSFILAVYEHGVIVLPCFTGIPAALLFYRYIERHCYHAIPFILLHLVPFPVIYLFPFPGPYYHYVYYAFLTVESLRSFTVWKNSGEKPYSGTPWGLFAFTVVLYTISAGYQMTRLSTLIYYCGTALIMVHFFRLSLEGISNTLSKTQHATSVPVRKMILINIMTTMFVSLILLIIAIAVHVFKLDSFLRDLGSLVVQICRVVFRFLSYIVTIIRAIFSVDSHIDSSFEWNLDETLEYFQEPSLLARIIDGLFIIIALFVLLYLLYRAISRIVHIFFLRYAQNADQIVQLNNADEKTVKKKEKGRLWEKVKNFFYKDNRTRIRYLYKIKIKSFNGDIYQKSDTPASIAEKVENLYSEDIRSLTEVYEKARYSNETITLEDVQKGNDPC
ncbi:MAG: DUF4129 domain-containing protein [Clostridium sp.]|nr:DUF4129 domain-containing protein [Clostridium sp.]